MISQHAIQGIQGVHTNRALPTCLKKRLSPKELLLWPIHAQQRCERRFFYWPQPLRWNPFPFRIVLRRGEGLKSADQGPPQVACEVVSQAVSGRAKLRAKNATSE